MKRAAVWVGAVGTLIFAASVPASAQSGSTVGRQNEPTATGGPRRSWFGNRTGRVGQDLTANLTFGGGRLRRDGLTQSTQTNGQSIDTRLTFVSGDVAYGAAGARAGISSRLAGDTSYFSQFDGKRLATYRGGIDGYVQISTSTRLSAGQSADLEPTVLRSLRSILDIGGSQSTPTPIDFGTSGERTLSYATTAQLQHALSPRAQLSFDLSRRQSAFGFGGVDDVPERRQTTEELGGAYTHQLTRSFGLRLGYTYGRSRASDGSPVAVREAIDAGLDFNRALSLTRQTTLAFGTGTTLVRSNEGTRFLLTGHAELEHLIGRTWSTAVAYARDVRFIDGITEATVVDQVSTTVGGLLSRQVFLQLQARAVRGEIGEGADGNSYTGLTGGGAITFALTRTVGVGVRYAYTQADFQNDRQLLAFPFQSSRQHSTGLTMSLWRDLSLGVTYSQYRYGTGGVSGPLAAGTGGIGGRSLVGSITFSAPIYSRSRRPDATR